MITITLATTDRTITEYRTEDPARALDVATSAYEDDDYVFIKIDQSLGRDLGRVVLRAWADYVTASQGDKQDPLRPLPPS